MLNPAPEIRLSPSLSTRFMTMIRSIFVTHSVEKPKLYETTQPNCANGGSRLTFHRLTNVQVFQVHF